MSYSHSTLNRARHMSHEHDLLFLCQKVLIFNQPHKKQHILQVHGATMLLRSLRNLNLLPGQNLV